MNIDPATSAPEDVKVGGRSVRNDPTERALVDLAIAFWGRWWAWCLAWGAVFAIAVWFAVLSISEQSDVYGSTSNLIDAAAFPLLEFGLLALLLASTGTGFRFTFEKRWLRAIALWVVTSLASATLGVVLARPLMRARMDRDPTGDPDSTITVAVAQQLHQIPGTLAWMFVVALIAAMFGVVIGLIVRVIRARKAR